MHALHVAGKRPQGVFWEGGDSKIREFMWLHEPGIWSRESMVFAQATVAAVPGLLQPFVFIDTGCVSLC